MAQRSDESTDELDASKAPKPVAPRRGDEKPGAKREGKAAEAGAAVLGWLGWVLLALFLVFGGGAYYYVLPEWRGMEHDLATTRSDLAHTTARAEAAEEHARAAEARANDEATQLSQLQSSCDDERNAMRAELASARSRADEATAMVTRLQSAAAQSGTEVERSAGQVTLRLVDQLLFRPGEADLTDAGKDVLGRLATALASFPDQQIWVQGHTDDTPVRANASQFPSNWELSAARALSVVHYLQDVAGIDPHRLAAVGFGQYRPASSTDQARNRRIEIVLLPQTVRMVEAHPNP